jgi:hypothetical protein
MNTTLLSIISCAVLLFTGGEQPQPRVTQEQRSAIEQAVIAKNAEVTSCAEQLDAEKLYDMIIEGGTGTIIQNGRVLTRQEALDSTKIAYEGISSQKIEFTQQNVNVLSPEIAVFTGMGKSVFTTNSGETFTSNFAVTSVFVLKDGEWKIVHGHHSRPNI